MDGLGYFTLGFIAGMLAALSIIVTVAYLFKRRQPTLGGPIEVDREALVQYIEDALQPKKKKTRTMWGDV